MDTFTLQIIDRLGGECRIDPAMIRSIIQTETEWANTVRYEEDYRYISNVMTHARNNHITFKTETVLQRMSWGLMQVMGGTARDLGYEGHLLELATSQALGLEYGVRYLKSRYVKYAPQLTGWSETVVAAYNAGSPKKRGDGTWVNEDYVRKCEKNYLALRKL